MNRRQIYVLVAAATVFAAIIDAAYTSLHAPTVQRDVDFTEIFSSR